MVTLRVVLNQNQVLGVHKIPYNQYGNNSIQQCGRYAAYKMQRLQYQQRTTVTYSASRELYYYITIRSNTKMEERYRSSQKLNSTYMYAPLLAWQHNFNKTSLYAQQ